MQETDKYLKELLVLMSQKDASDLHLSVGSPPFIRVDGEISPLTFPVLTNEEIKKMFYSIMNQERLKYFNKNKVVDFSFGIENVGRFRINIYKQRNSMAAAIRIVSHEIPKIDELGLPTDTVKSLCNRPNGLLLVAGPTGSGKSTSLAAMVNYINNTRRNHILTIEDPIEYVHSNINSLIHQRELGTDTQNFSSALKYCLREDPDVVLIGELRDLETISSAITMAETGHLVLSTLHTGEASESLQRMINVFPGDQQDQIAIQLSFTLVGVINQQLVSRKDGSGRELACEVMVATPAVKNIIREKKHESVYSHIQLGSEYGMRTMNQSLYELVSSGKINQENALSKSARIKELVKLIESR